MVLLKSKLFKYSNINNKIGRDIRDGMYFKIIKGLYETVPNTPGYLLIGSIYGFLYSSSEYALSYYGLIMCIKIPVNRVFSSVRLKFTFQLCII